MEDGDGELHSLISVKLNVVNVKISRQIGQAVPSPRVENSFIVIDSRCDEPGGHKVEYWHGQRPD